MKTIIFFLLKVLFLDIRASYVNYEKIRDKKAQRKEPCMYITQIRISINTLLCYHSLFFLWVPVCVCAGASKQQIHL